MERTRKREDGGFSLVEIVVALLILSAGIFGLAMVQLTAFSARNAPVMSRTRIAAGLAQDGLDRFRTADWDALQSSRPEGFIEGPGGAAPAFSHLSSAAGDWVDVQGTRYYRIWRVEQDPEIRGLKTLSVWCCWRHGEDPWRQVVLVTQRARVEH